ncbi:MAG: DUF5703 domain-containing protein [Verrucomicrobia bacterium]|nr:DUF5703 domain-containing protein [Verrucomicrobiota bacterium]
MVAGLCCAGIPAICGADYDPLSELDAYNVVWLSPSADFNGSMPLGNGDLGVNAWCQAGNDLVFYISKTDAWCESGRLLKLGRVRVGLTPNPFASGQPFRQELNLRNGEILITAGSGASAATLRIWVDANHPAICVDGQSPQPCNWRVDVETWRTADRTLTGQEAFSAYGIMDGPSPIVVKPDTIVGGQINQVLWYHRNVGSIWADTFRIQSLGYLTNSLIDPLISRTFGAVLTADGLTNSSATRLLSAGVRTNLTLTIVPLTTVTNSVTEWQAAVNATAASVAVVDRQQRYAAHCAWWQDFWRRHWIVVHDNAGAASLDMITTNASALSIGADNTGGTLFPGRMARASIYGAPLNPLEVAALAATDRHAPVHADSRLVAAWLFNQITNNQVPDAANGKFPLSVVGSVSVTNDGSSNVLSFSGGYLREAHQPALNLINGFTLEAWIAPDVLPASGARIIDKGVVGTALGYILDTYPGNGLRSIINKGIMTYAANLAPGVWVHVANTVDTAAGTQNLYVNGVLVQQATYTADAFTVTRGYVLQRVMNACSGRGGAPIKFNGSIFTVDGNDGGQWDADYRAWGPCYWFQNTRLPYHSMVAAGDFDLMQPLFKMYLDALPVARARVQTYYGHAGAYFPETMYFWGTWNNDNYGWDRTGKTVGRSDNPYIRWEWQGGIELTSLMLDYYESTQDAAFATNTLVPLASEIVDLYDYRFPRDGKGKIIFAPSQALETYWEGTTNPMPEVAGLSTVLTGLLNLPTALVPPARTTQWTRLLAELPPIPTRVLSSQTVLSPAAVLGPKGNIEEPELYAVFPYRQYGVGLPNLDLAQRTYDLRADPGNSGWKQDAIFAAMLGRASDAKSQVASRFAAKNVASRFPAFFGPNYDWVPDQDHGGVAMTALQKMVLQCVGDRIILCSAWPAGWDVEFKLHAPKQTILQGTVRGGSLESLTVTPVSRTKDVEIMSLSSPLVAELYAGILVRGTLGAKYRIEYREALNSPTQWQPLATITLTNNPYGSSMRSPTCSKSASTGQSCYLSISEASLRASGVILTTRPAAPKVRVAGGLVPYRERG